MTRKEDEENIQIIEEKNTKVYNIYKKERSNDIGCFESVRVLYFFLRRGIALMGRFLVLISIFLQFELCRTVATLVFPPIVFLIGIL